MIIKQRYTAFTLAEVLITLLIIGVVASLVIPGLINDSKKAEYVTKLQKEYSVLQQAYKLIILDEGGSILNNPDFNCSGTCNTSRSSNAMNTFASKLSIIKNCGTEMGCWYRSSRRFLGGSIHNTNLDLDLNTIFGKAILKDGTMIVVNIYNLNCSMTAGSVTNNSNLYQSVCGYIGIDINGEQKPNQYGRDYYEFWIAKTGIYPRGLNGDGRSCEIDSDDFTTSSGCAAKILSEGAMSY